jgi:hypothetical protein
MAEERGLLYVWNEICNKYLWPVLVPLFPFVILAGLLNASIRRRIPRPLIPVVRRFLQIIFLSGLVLGIAISALSVMNCFGIWRVPIAHDLFRRPLFAFFVIWVTGGMYMFWVLLTFAKLEKPENK